MKWDSSHKLVALIVRIAILLLLVALALWKTDLRAVIAFLSGRMAAYIILLQPIAFLCAVLLAKRYETLLQNPNVKFTVALKAIILANGINVILPGRLSELLKATYVNEKTGHSISRALSAIVLERLGDIFILLMLALGCVGSVFFQVDILYLSLLGVVIIGLLGLLAGSEKAIFSFASRLRSRLVSGFLQQFVTHAAGSLKSRSFYIGQFYGVLAWTSSFILMSLLVFLVGSIRIGLSQSLLLFTATTVGLLIPLLPGGIGTYEAAAIYVLRGFGYGLEEALVLSIAMHVSQLAFVFVASLTIVSSERIGIMSLLKRMRTVSSGANQPTEALQHQKEAEDHDH